MYSSSRLPKQSLQSTPQGSALENRINQSTRLMNNIIRQVDSDDEEEQPNTWVNCEEGESANVQKKIRKAANVDEVFNILVKEHVDFRDIRYQNFSEDFAMQMDDFNKEATGFENGGNVPEGNSLNSSQIQSNMQQKLYQHRNRDQKDLHERYEKLIRGVRDSHVVEVKNLTSKFKGIVKDSVQRALDEQKKVFEAEHRQLIDNQYQLRATIHKLEEQASQFQSKLDEKEKRLMDCYDKIMKLNNDSSSRKSDMEKFARAVKEKDVAIDKMGRQLKGLEDLEAQKKSLDACLKEKEVSLKEKDGIIHERDRIIAKMQKQLQTEKEKVDKSSRLSGKRQLSEDELAKNSNRREVSSPEKEITKRGIDVFLYPTAAQEEQSNKSSVVGPKKRKTMPVFINLNSGFKHLQKARREELSQQSIKTKELQSVIKLKEDQIKLLQVEVLSLREESHTYLQNLFEMRSAIPQIPKPMKKKKDVSQPNLNDLILDPSRIVESNQLSTKRVYTGSSEDSSGKYVSSVFQKSNIQLNASNSSSRPSSMRVQRGVLENNKENLQREGLLLGNLTSTSIQNHSISFPHSAKVVSGSTLANSKVEFPTAGNSEVAIGDSEQSSTMSSGLYKGVMNNLTIAKTLRDRANSHSSYVQVVPEVKQYNGPRNGNFTAPAIRRPLRSNNFKTDEREGNDVSILSQQALNTAPFYTADQLNSLTLLIKDPEIIL